MKFVLFVEGLTERKAVRPFLQRWLDANVTPRVGLRVVRFQGWADYYKEIAKKVRLNLTGRSGHDVVAAIGLLDLYGPTFYPQDKVVARDRYLWAKAHIEKQVGHPRFRQHFAVHETEAWLLADPSIHAPQLSSQIAQRSAHPETINFDCPPARLLDRIYAEHLKRSYQKVIDGASLFGNLDPAVAKSKCPFLGALLDDMLELARTHVPE